MAQCLEILCQNSKKSEWIRLDRHFMSAVVLLFKIKLDVKLPYYCNKPMNKVINCYHHFFLRFISLNILELYTKASGFSLEKRLLARGNRKHNISKKSKMLNPLQRRQPAVIQYCRRKRFELSLYFYVSSLVTRLSPLAPLFGVLSWERYLGTWECTRDRTRRSQRSLSRGTNSTEEREISYKHSIISTWQVTKKRLVFSFSRLNDTDRTYAGVDNSRSKPQYYVHLYSPCYKHAASAKACRPCTPTS